MTHPFEKLQSGARSRLFAAFLVVTFAIQAILIISGLSLKTDAAPLGILSYEFAGTADRATAIVASWSSHRGAAYVNLLVDYAFMIAYSCSIALGCVWAKSVLSRRVAPLAALGSPLAWGQWLAAVLDAVENAGLIYFMVGTPTTPIAATVWWCAAVKFALVLAGILYAAIGLTTRLSLSENP